jgi:hypothetical protein
MLALRNFIDRAKLTNRDARAKINRRDPQGTQMRMAAAAVLAIAMLPPPAFAAVDVSRSAISGTGQSTDPWRGWEDAVAWKEHTEYVFPAGV